jgi:hypothetical protein
MMSVFSACKGTTRILQPPDQFFFKALEAYYNQEGIIWKAASISDGSSCLRAIGIFFVNPYAMPCHFFSITENCDSMFRSRTTTFSIHMR